MNVLTIVPPGLKVLVERAGKPEVINRPEVPRLSGEAAVIACNHIGAAANSPGTAQSRREGCRHRASPNRRTFHLGRPLTRATRCPTSPWDEMRHGLGRKGLPPLHGRRPTSAQFREVEPRRGP